MLPIMTTDNSGSFTVSIIIRLIIAASVATKTAGAQQQPCDLAKNECIPFKECDVLYKLYGGDEVIATPEFVETLEASRCDTVTADVCCPKLNEPVVGPEVGVRFGEEPLLCQTPNRQSGVCIPVRNCRQTLQLLAKRNQLTRKESVYLRQSQCGYQNRSPLVCCASEPQSMHTKRQNQASHKALLPNFEKCGATSSNRIVGGRNAKVDEYPWLAMVEYSDKQMGKRGFHCGASLITAQFTLTAAHCVSSLTIPSRYQPLSIRLGEWDTSTAEDCDQESDNEDCVDQPVQDIPIDRFVVHEQYRNQDVNTLNDIALIKLSRPAVFNFYVSPICLPYTDQLKNLNLEGLSLDVAGWGLTEFGYKSNIKQKVDVPVVGIKQCQQVFPTKRLQASQICAGGVAGKDSCNGDSGGPLMKHHSDGRRQFTFLAGIVSYGNTACGKQGFPGVYTRVGSYIDWITANLQR